MIMYDSTTAADIPADAGWVAGYVDGLYKWSPEDWGRFPDAHKITIATNKATDWANVLDVENGDATPADARTWLTARQALGEDGIIYCSKDSISAVAAAIYPLKCLWWLADWTGQPHLIPGSWATQYADPATGSGGHYDLSLLAGGITVDPTEQAVLNALNTGTGDGQPDWASTNKAILATVQSLVNEIAALTAKVDALTPGAPSGPLTVSLSGPLSLTGNASLTGSATP